MKYAHQKCIRPTQSVTEWFCTSSHKPKHVGVYMTKVLRFDDDSFEVWYQHWNGVFFGLVKKHPEDAELWGLYKSAYQPVAWCGIAR